MYTCYLFITIKNYQIEIIIDELLLDSNDLYNINVQQNDYYLESAKF